MTEVSVHYGNLLKRGDLISQYEAQGLVMLHDDFDPDWQVGDEPHGTLVFDTPVPMSSREMELEAIAEEVSAANDLALQAYQHWDSLTLAQKDKALKMLLGEYIVRHKENYSGVL